MSAAMNGHSGDCYCHYLPHLIAVRPDGDEKRRAIDMTGGEELDNGEACRLLDGLDHEIVAAVLDAVGVIRVADEDPHELVNQLNEAGVDASPIHGMGYLGHGGYQGSDWSPAPSVDLSDVDDATTGKDGRMTIAVVDSGIVDDEDLPEWMRPSSVRSSRPIDSEVLPHKDPVSHGTFVTSVIRRVAPEVTVSITSARPDPGHLTHNDPNHESAPPPTDELNVLGAIIRLQRRHRDDDTIRAFNLSLGVHACPGDAYNHFLAIRSACDLWIESFGDAAPIFAAAGNSDCPQPLYPAAFNREDHYKPFIHGVAAAREGKEEGELKVWDHGDEIGAPDRDWVTDAAPGCDVIGLSGQAPDHVISWGGSSHATAVVTACYVRGCSWDDDQGVRWWPDRAVTYSNVPNLVP